MLKEAKEYKESKSLQRLKKFLTQIPKGFIGFKASDYQIQPTEDTLEFIAKHPNLDWEKIGNVVDRTGKKTVPCYSKYISVHGELRGDIDVSQY